MSDELDESPTAGQSYESASAGPSGTGTSERNIGSLSIVNEEEDGEDVPNWIAFADFAAKWVFDTLSHQVYTSDDRPPYPSRIVNCHDFTTHP